MNEARPRVPSEPKPVKIYRFLSRPRGVNSQRIKPKCLMCCSGEMNAKGAFWERLQSDVLIRCTDTFRVADLAALALSQKSNPSSGMGASSFPTWQIFGRLRAFSAAGKTESAVVSWVFANLATSPCIPRKSLYAELATPNKSFYAELVTGGGSRVCGTTKGDGAPRGCSSGESAVTRFSMEGDFSDLATVFG